MRAADGGYPGPGAPVRLGSLVDKVGTLAENERVSANLVRNLETELPWAALSKP